MKSVIIKDSKTGKVILKVSEKSKGEYEAYILDTVKPHTEITVIGENNCRTRLK